MPRLKYTLQEPAMQGPSMRTDQVHKIRNRILLLIIQGGSAEKMLATYPRLNRVRVQVTAIDSIVIATSL